MYLQTPRVLVEGSWIAMFSASIGGGSRGTTSYYRAGTPSYTTSEGPARYSLSLFTHTPPRRNLLLLLPREGCGALLRWSSRHVVNQASARLVGRWRLRLG